MRILFGVLSFAALLSACGKDTINFNSLGVRKNVNQVVSDSQTMYEALPGDELSVFMDPSDGSTQTQKQNETSFCRKIHRPEMKTVFQFECWNSKMTSDESRSQYSLISTRPYYVNVGNIVGSGTQEKISLDKERLCQETTGAYPGAIPIYRCYLSL